MRVVHGSTSDTRLPDPGLRALFSVDARRKRYLDVEAALADAQGECGVIPASAARSIAECARLELLDPHRLTELEATTGHALMPIIGELSRVVGETDGGWVHWGATTQNIQQTGDVLGLRAAHHSITDLLVDVIDVLADLAEANADIVMAGRTHHQQAVPITLGLKVAAWADAMLRHLDRLDALPGRLFIAMAGGAAGTFAAMGPAGPDVQDALAERLGLISMPVPARSLVDPVRRAGRRPGSVVGDRFFHRRGDLAAGRGEFGELAETLPHGDVGSWTMPQKRNSKLSGEIITIGAQIRALVPLALEAVIQSHEVDGARSAMMDEAVEQAVVLTGDALTRLREVLTHLQVFADRMRVNLDLTQGAITAEAVMMVLADDVGRQSAHDRVHHAATTAATTGRAFSDVLAQDPTVASHLNQEQRAALLDPTRHTGESAAIARATAARTRAHLHQRAPSGADDARVEAAG